MLHPSYTELMEKINKEGVQGDEPVINSRYSIVIAAAKRARELIGGKNPRVDGVEGEKPLSIAVKELYELQTSILAEGDDEEALPQIEEREEDAEKTAGITATDEMPEE